MVSEVRKQIDKIQRGIVPTGYYKTKYGIFPKDWKEDILGNYIEEYTVFSNDISNYPVYSSTRQGLVLQSQYFDDKESTVTNLGYRIVLENYATYRHMSDDDIFHFNINTSNKQILVSSEYPVFKNQGNSDLYFIISILNELPRFRYFCRSNKTGGTRTRLYYNTLCTYKTSFPPLKEQKAISKILIAQDNLIALKEKLLAEKQKQKKYLMQMLLRGKLKSGECQKVKISDICEISTGATPDTKNKKFWNGNIRWMNSGELNLKKIYEVEGRITNLAVQKTSTQLLPEKCVLIGLAGQGKTRGTVAMNYVPLCTNQSIAAVHPNDSYCSEFLYYNLEFRYDELRKISSGDGARGGLTLKIIGNVEVVFPSLKEQTKIANILSTADKELSLLRQDIEQEKLEKKALQQLLLTGIVRVKI